MHDMKFDNDPEGTRLPVKMNNTTNGEHLPKPVPEHVHKAASLAREWCTENSRRLSKGRRDFLVSMSGAATCLLAMNRVNTAMGSTGAEFEVPAEAALDEDAAIATLGKQEFIFDIQTHHFDTAASWTEHTPWTEAVRFTSKASGCDVLPDNDFGHMICIDARTFVREIFIDSDTDAAILTFVPTEEDKMPLNYQEASATRQLVDAMDGSKRLLLHGRIIPNLPGDLERMDSVMENWDIAAWKTYTQYGESHSQGWWLDDEETGQPFCEAVRQSGVKTICCHKGLPLPFPLMGEQNLEYRSCRDVGPAASANPDLSFIIYHSGFDPDFLEAPFVPGEHASGADSLVQSLLNSGVGPNSNVYAELGTSWWEVMKHPDQAAHLLGKLLKFVGEDNVVWGTDCVFYGSPQDQIQALRTFQISPEFQERYGYPEITNEIRAKIFGLNSARAYGLDIEAFSNHASTDVIARARENYRGRNDPSFRTYGPRTRREFLSLAQTESA
jgi:hypothetical protein